MAEFVKVAQTSEVAPGQIVFVQADGKDISLLNINGQFYAVSDVCSHEECNMSDGGELEGETIICPCHASAFDVRTGAVANPPATAPIETYPVRVEGTDILVSA